MKKRRFLAVAIVLVMACLYCPIANAARNEGSTSNISPMWTNVSSVTPLLGFSGMNANCGAKVVGISGTTIIVATITLERKNTNGTYTKIKTWANQSTTNSTFTFSDTYGVTAGYTYRLTVSADVTRNGITEMVSNWVENNCK